MIQAKGRAGFTLTEMLFSVVILSVVTAAVFTLFYSNQFAATITGDQSAGMSDTQAALRKIAADLTPASGFVTPTYTGGLRVTAAGGAAVEYYVDGTALKRATSSGATTTVVSDVVSGTGLSLSYLNGSMTAIAGPMDSTKYAQAVAVDVTVTINLDHTAFGQVSRTTRVMLRNKIS